jgi:hypothetical protein
VKDRQVLDQFLMPPGLLEPLSEKESEDVLPSFSAEKEAGRSLRPWRHGLHRNSSVITAPRVQGPGILGTDCDQNPAAGNAMAADVVTAVLSANETM